MDTGTATQPTISPAMLDAMISAELAGAAHWSRVRGLRYAQVLDLLDAALAAEGIEPAVFDSPAINDTPEIASNVATVERTCWRCMGDGWVSEDTPCPNCDNRGIVLVPLGDEAPCPDCDGTGRVTVTVGRPADIYANPAVVG